MPIEPYSHTVRIPSYVMHEFKTFHDACEHYLNPMLQIARELPEETGKVFYLYYQQLDSQFDNRCPIEYGGDVVLILRNTQMGTKEMHMYGYTFAEAYEITHMKNT